MPPNEDPGSGFNAPAPRRPHTPRIAALFQAHPLVLDNMVKRYECGFELPLWQGHGWRLPGE